MNAKPESRAKMSSQRIKYAMAHLSRKQHISLLARPNWRRIKRVELMHILADPNAISRAALRCRPSNRIRIMAQPKYVTKKFDPVKLPPPYQRVHPKTLAAIITRRILDLALPNIRLLQGTLKFAERNKNLAIIVNDLLRRHRTSRYRRYRLLCNATIERASAMELGLSVRWLDNFFVLFETLEQQETILDLSRTFNRLERSVRRKSLMAKLRKTTLKPDDWEQRQNIILKLSAPKAIPRPKPLVSRKKWRPVDVVRLENLSLPNTRLELETRDPYKVSRAALGYEISNRMRAIATREVSWKIDTPRIPGAVSRAALKAVASTRTIILAKPSVRPTGVETDLREDAFTVSPSALKARCSKRLKVLARPKMFGGGGGMVGRRRGGRRS